MTCSQALPDIHMHHLHRFLNLIETPISLALVAQAVGQGEGLVGIPGLTVLPTACRGHQLFRSSRLYMLGYVALDLRVRGGLEGAEELVMVCGPTAQLQVS